MPRKETKPDEPQASRRRRRRDSLPHPWRANPLYRWLALVPVVAAFGAYSNSLDGKFLFDDKPAVEDNAQLKESFWDAAFGEVHSPISNRPVTCASLAFDYSTAGISTRHYHVTNTLLHAINAALVFLVVRRLLRTPAFNDRYDDRTAAFVAVAAALLWSVHPLGCEAVAYITQRSTLLMSAFSLLALYGSLRAFESEGRERIGWQIAGVCAVYLAVGSKEDAVVLPLLIVLFDRAFLFAVWIAAFRARAWFYLGVAAGWLILATFVAAGPENTTIGYHTSPPLTAGDWLMTQAPVVAHYVRLIFWPEPLTPAYAWPFVHTLSSAMLPGMFVLTLLGATVWLWIRKPASGFAGLWFFLWLAPTSTVLPIVTEVAAERRMYLPLLGAMVPLAIVGRWAVAKLVARFHLQGQAAAGAYAVPVAAIALVAAVGTWRHTGVYADPITMWRYSTQQISPENRSYSAGAVFTGYGKALIDAARSESGRDFKKKFEYDDAAIEVSRKAIVCEPPQHKAYTNLGGLLVEKAERPSTLADEQQSLREEAESYYRYVVEHEPNNFDAHNNWAKLSLDAYQAGVKKVGPTPELIAKLQEGFEHATRAVQINEAQTNAWSNLGSFRYFLNDPVGAEQAFLRALQLDPQNTSAAINLQKIRGQLR